MAFQDILERLRAHARQGLLSGFFTTAAKGPCSTLYQLLQVSSELAKERS